MDLAMISQISQWIIRKIMDQLQHNPATMLTDIHNNIQPKGKQTKKIEQFKRQILRKHNNFFCYLWHTVIHNHQIMIKARDMHRIISKLSPFMFDQTSNGDLKLTQSLFCSHQFFSISTARYTVFHWIYSSWLQYNTVWYIYWLQCINWLFTDRLR